jgi:hypothetical protein
MLRTRGSLLTVALIEVFLLFLAASGVIVFWMAGLIPNAVFVAFVGLLGLAVAPRRGVRLERRGLVRIRGFRRRPIPWDTVSKIEMSRVFLFASWGRVVLTDGRRRELPGIVSLGWGRSEPRELRAIRKAWAEAATEEGRRLLD